MYVYIEITLLVVAMAILYLGYFGFARLAAWVYC